MMKFVLRNVVNDQLIVNMMFDTEAGATEYREFFTEKGTAWIDYCKIIWEK
jgi:hypothetical protein|tara:strand:+ start:805 stop:957 length:153 start_codon:yes stop_codon:yes gene_type:complete